MIHAQVALMILLAYGKHSHDRIISLRGGRRRQKKYNISPPLFIEVPVLSQETDWSYICVLGVSIVVSFYDLSVGFASLVEFLN
jgi:hypothetical protein